MRKLKKNFIPLSVLLLASACWGQGVGDILDAIDSNLSSANRVMEASMTIHGRRKSRTITMKSWASGSQKAFTEYLSPATEQGTKMLKLSGQMWIYSPSSDRIIQISGHLLRQSVMGSDLSYEDMLEDRKLSEIYDAKIVADDTMDGRKVWIMELTARVPDLAYHKQRMWVDSERFIPVKQELYAKSGQLLKQMEARDIRRIQGRWFPMTVVYTDMLKQSSGTEFMITDIKFDQKIPDHMFTKAALRQ